MRKTYGGKFYNKACGLRLAAAAVVAAVCVFCAPGLLCPVSHPAVGSNIFFKKPDDGPLNITDASKLETLLGEKNIRREDVIEIIGNNPYLSPRYKKMAADVLDAYIRLAPSGNLIIYYENLKDLRIVEVSPEEIQAELNDIAGGYYDISENIIYISCGLSDFGIYHELAHAANSFIRVIDGTTVRRLPSPDKGTALEEAMTNYLVKDLTLYTGNYYKEFRLLNYLVDVSGLQYDTYAVGGVASVLDYLSTRYPEIDFSSIAEKLDSFTEGRLSLDREYDPALYDDVIDALFPLCLECMTDGNSLENWEAYASFEPRDIEQKFTAYFQAYREQFGFDAEKLSTIIERLIEHEDINEFLYEDDRLYLLSYRGQDNEDTVYLSSVRDNYHTLYSKNIGKNPLVYHYIDETGYTADFTPKSKYLSAVRFNYRGHLPEYIYLFDPDFDFSEASWLHLLKAANLLTPIDCGEVPLYYKGKLLCNLHITSNTCVQIGENTDGECRFILYDGSRVLYDNCGAKDNLSDRIELKGLLAAYNRVDRVEFAEILSENYLNKMLYYIYDDVPNITDDNGQYVFCSPLKLKITDSGKKMPARELYLSVHPDGSAYIRSVNGIDEKVDFGQYFDYQNSLTTLFVYFDDVMRFYNFTYDDEEYIPMSMDNIKVFFSCYSQLTNGWNVSMHK